MTKEQADRLGEIADAADSYAAAASIPMPASFHKAALVEGLQTIRDDLRNLYREATGEDPWGDALE